MPKIGADALESIARDKPSLRKTWTMKKTQGGFTLIELVMVIVILGVLAAVALPKFVDLKGDAQGAAIQGAAGALSSASAINYATSSIRGAANCTGGATGCVRLNAAAPAAALVATGGGLTGWDSTNFTITTDTTCNAVAVGVAVTATLTYLNSSPAKTANATIICTG